MNTCQTSAEAFALVNAKGLLSERRLAIYNILYQHGPLTSNEAFSHVDGTVSAENANVHSRINELRKMGVVAPAGVRKCGITGMSVTAWKTTENLPDQGGLERFNKRLRMTRLIAKMVRKLEAAGVTPEQDEWLAEAKEVMALK